MERLRAPDLYRQVTRGAPFHVQGGAADLEVRVGDLVHAAVVRGLGAAQRSALGPVLSAAQASKIAGYAIEAGQRVVRPVTPGAAAPERAGTAETIPAPLAGPVAVVVCSGDEAADRAAIAAALDAGAGAGAGAVALVDPDVELADGWLERLERALVASGAPAAVPLCNHAAPVSLPMPSDSGSPLPRLPGGRSVWQVDAALAADPAPPTLGHPAAPCCVLLSRPLADLAAQGARPLLNGAVIARDVFAWRPAERAGPVAALVDGYRGHLPRDWAQATERERQAVARHRPGGLPVALYTCNVGPWGGVAVLLRLADELQRLGMDAAVVYHTLTDHKFAPRTPPLKVRNAASLEGDWRGHVGWDRGIVVASHWGSGPIVRSILRRNPGLVGTSILQDREDLFEMPDGRVRNMPVADYFAIGSGAAVARWILDSAASDLGVDVSGYRVIPAGIDTAVFRPRLGARRPGGPVRVLAMWRPQTGVRRGMARLRAVYEATKRRFGGRVSLELFGWRGREADGDAPPACVDVHHGVLSQEGVAALMAEVGIVVEPSEYQGFGLPGIEAMAAGACLVSTDCQGPREYVHHGEDGLLVPHDTLGDALAAAIEDEALRARLQAAAPAAVRRFDWKRVAAAWALFLAERWAAAGGAPEICARAVDVARERLEEPG